MEGAQFVVDVGGNQFGPWQAERRLDGFVGVHKFYDTEVRFRGWSHQGR